MLSVSLQQKHALLPTSSHNGIAWVEEAGTMTFNNYLAQIVFPYLSLCKFCLHCFGCLWAIDTSGFLFCASHADGCWSQSRSVFAKATGAVCEQAELATRSKCPRCFSWSPSKLGSFLINCLTFTENHCGGKAPLDRWSSLKITVDRNQSLMRADKRQIPEAAESMIKTRPKKRREKQM